MKINVFRTLVRYVEYGLLASVPFIIFIGNQISSNLMRSFSYFVFLFFFVRYQYYHVSSHRKIKGFLSFFIIPYGIFALLSGLAYLILPAQFFNLVFLPLRYVEYLESVTTFQSILIIHVANAGFALIFTMLGIWRRIKWREEQGLEEDEIPEWILERRNKEKGESQSDSPEK